ncbi:MAG: branched-chain amino acid ABC transporter permease [Parasporobacterium sp.]|nr:branched-chain amino acid ABC transporter permease [Parasporobacterium sp.]
MLLQIILRSLETGGIYALASLGIIIIFRTSRISHFAQGAMGMFNTYVAAVLVDRMGLPLGIGVIVAVCLAVFIGFLVDFLVIRRAKNAIPVTKQILTLGLVTIFVGLAPMVCGVDPLSLPKFIPTGNISVAGASLSYNGLLNILIGIIIMLVLFYTLLKTKLGIAIRTTASNEPVARLMGVPTRNVTLFAWAVAAVLGCLAGIMQAPSTSVTTGVLDTVQINALIACVLGGFQTFYGPVIGSYIIALSSNLLNYYVSSVWGNQLVYLCILIFVVFRPQGIVGKKVVKKV